MELASRDHTLTRSFCNPTSNPLPGSRGADLRTDTAPGGGQSCIGRGLRVTGTIAGEVTLESLFIEGTVEGAIELPASRVTVGASGRVKAGILACDIVVLGAVEGDLNAAQRIDLRGRATVTGNACAPRVRIEDSVDFHGKLIAGVEAQQAKSVDAERSALAPALAAPAEPARALRAPVEGGRRLRAPSALQTA